MKTDTHKIYRRIIHRSDILRLGDKKIIYIRKSRESKKKFSAFLIVLLFVSFVIFGALYFAKEVRPVMISLAKTQSKVMAQRAINNAIISIFADNPLSYEDVLIIEKEDNGSVSAVKSNLESVNKLKAELLTKIQNYISEIERLEVYIPLGTIMGSDIFSGIGPSFSVDFVPSGIAAVDFVSKFEDAGINQTRLTIDLNVKATIMLVMPSASAGIDVETKVPVIQTVIVGDVPQSYTNVERTGEEYEEDLMNLLN